MQQARTYQLLIRVPREVRVAIGSLGLHTFQAGYYIYTGSAKRNLEARLRRHLCKDKRLHWHIDSLLGAPGVRIVEVQRSTIAECELNKVTGGALPVRGFGASDCRAHCGAHLKYRGWDGFPEPAEPYPSFSTHGKSYCGNSRLRGVRSASGTTCA